MKKNLLFVLSLIITLVASAQRTMPVPVHTSSVSFTGDAVLSNDTIIYYLYNKDANAFYTEGNNYGTRASLDVHGLKVAIVKYIEKDEIGFNKDWDGKSVYIKNYSIVKGIWDQLFVNENVEPYVDCSGRGNNIWSLIPVAEGVYNLAISDLNPINSKVNPSSAFLGLSAAAQSANSTAMTATNAAGTGAMIDWVFVPEKNYKDYSYQYDCYLASLKLKEALDYSQNLEGIDVRVPEAIYLDNTASLQDIEMATENLWKTIFDKEYANATDDEPYDVTKFLVNPDFSDGNTKGWNTTYIATLHASEVGFQTARPKGYKNGEVVLNDFFQIWSNGVSYYPSRVKGVVNVGELSQTLNGVPTGKYKLTADCIAVNQYMSEANPVYGVQLYANGGTLDSFVEVATKDYAPEHFELLFPNDGNSIKFGIRTVEGCTPNWVAASNFKLYYFGSDYTAIEGVSNNSDSKESAIYTLSGARVNSFKKGINIIRNADGSVSKMYVK